MARCSRNLAHWAKGQKRSFSEWGQTFSALSSTLYPYCAAIFLPSEAFYSFNNGVKVAYFTIFPKKAKNGGISSRNKFLHKLSFPVNETSYLNLFMSEDVRIAMIRFSWHVFTLYWFFQKMFLNLICIFKFGLKSKKFQRFPKAGNVCIWKPYQCSFVWYMIQTRKVPEFCANGSESHVVIHGVHGGSYTEGFVFENNVPHFRTKKLVRQNYWDNYHKIWHECSF